MMKLEQILSPVERARCAAIPSLRAFVEAVPAAVQTDPDAFWSLTDAFSALMASSFLSDLVTWEIGCLDRDPDYVPCPRGERDLEVVRLGLVALGVRTLRPSPPPDSPLLYAFCEHHISANVGPGGVLVERWRQASDAAPDVFDRTRGLVPLPPLTIRQGERARFHAHRDVARISLCEGEAAVVVGLTRMQATRLRWVYDERTLLPARAEAGDLDAARLEYAMTLLSALGHLDAAPVMATLVQHPDHFVRWAAICRVMELDPVLGEPLVVAAVHDVHPHVRRAATRSIARHQATLAVQREENTRHGAHP